MTPLPFHVAVIPVAVDAVELGPREAVATEVDSVDVEENDPTDEESEEIEVKLEFDTAQFSQSLTAALDGRCFSRATLLASAPEGSETAAYPDEFWLEQAVEVGADLILKAELVYDDDITTELNDRFWLNLPLFLLGGPFCWWVDDRNYYFDVRLKADLYDVSAARRVSVLDAESHVARIDHEVKEASLDFMDRSGGDGGALALSILVPAGLLAKGSENVPDELEEFVAEQLGEELSISVQERSREINEELVAFYPEGVQVVGAPEARFLEGQMILELGDVTNLGSCRYRVNGGEFVEASWGEPTFDESGPNLVRRYPFRIALGDLEVGTIQLEIQQEDREASARTFTYLIPSTKEEE